MEDKELLSLNLESNMLLGEVTNTKINNQEDFEFASSFLKQVKAVQKKVKDYWETPIKNAYEAHKSLKNKENEMLKPLQESEKILKNKMQEYTEQQTKIFEEQLKRLKEEQEKEAMHELEEAERLRENGDVVGAEIAESNANMIYQMPTNLKSGVEKVEGIGYRKDYEIQIVDDTKVPAYINGIQIRKIDESQIKKLIKMTNGQIIIPGINVKEKKIISVRS